MRRYLIILGFALLACAATPPASKKVKWKEIVFKAIYPEGPNDVKKTFRIQILSGGKLRRGTTLFTGDYNTEYRILYPDSALFYISTKYLTGSSLNYKNALSIGHRGYDGRNLIDTINIQGYADSVFWREAIVGEVVLGYLNANQTKKELFDQSIDNFIGRNMPHDGDGEYIGTQQITPGIFYYAYQSKYSVRSVHRLMIKEDHTFSYGIAGSGDFKLKCEGVWRFISEDKFFLEATDKKTDHSSYMHETRTWGVELIGKNKLTLGNITLKRLHGEGPKVYQDKWGNVSD